MLRKPDFITACVAGLEIHLFGAEENAGNPVLFVEHGRGGSAEAMFSFCRDLRADGYIAIALSQRNHGRRLVNPDCNQGWGIGVAADMYGIIRGTAADISTIIDMLPATLGISTERLGVLGASLGGHATLMAMALDSRIQVGVPMIGSGDFLRLMELRAETNQVPADDLDDYLPPAMREAIARFDPINNPARFADRPLLMLNGAADTLVQAECNQRFEAAVRPFYTHPERLKLRLFERIGHSIPPEMWNEAREWLQLWLPT